MAIARVTVLDFTDEENKRLNLDLYKQRWQEVFPNMQMNMIISTGPTSFLSISVYENDEEAEANMEARTKLHEDFTNIKDDFFYKGDIQMFFQSDKFEKLKLKKLDDVGKQGNFQTIVTRKIEKSGCHS